MNSDSPKPRYSAPRRYTTRALRNLDRFAVPLSDSEAERVASILYSAIRSREAIRVGQPYLRPEDRP